MHLTELNEFKPRNLKLDCFIHLKFSFFKLHLILTTITVFCFLHLRYLNVIKCICNTVARFHIFLNRSCKGEVMSLQFFCAENRTNDWTNFWRRQRLVWWRKFANTPSNYTIQESQSDIKPGVNSYTLLEVRC